MPIEYKFDLELLPSDFDYFAKKYTKLRTLQADCFARQAPFFNSKKHLSTKDKAAFDKISHEIENLNREAKKLFVKPLTQALKEDRLEILQSPQIIDWIDLNQLRPFIIFSDNAEKALSLLEINASKTFDGLWLFCEIFKQDLSAEAAARCWTYVKALLEPDGENPSLSGEARASSFAATLLAFENGEEVSSSEASIWILNPDYPFISEKLRKHALAGTQDFTDRFRFRASPYYVRKLNPNFYQEQLHLHEIDEAVAEVLVSGWKADFKSFLLAAATLGPDFDGPR